MGHTVRFVSVLALLLSAIPCAARAATQEGGGVIAYCYQPIWAEGGPKRIYSIHADGSGNTKRSNAAIGLNAPDWSPDTTRFTVYGYPSEATWSIYVMAADGSDLTRLTTTEGVWDESPAWSPQGDRIVFTRTFPAQGYRDEIWLMDADGGNAHWIGVEGAGAVWSPDGTRFAYHSLRAGNVDLYVCDVDGTNEVRLTSAASVEACPAWSPDGLRIAFQTSRDGNWEIYVMDADGTGQTRVTVNAADDLSPAWSPDGALLAFNSDLDNPAADHWEIYVVEPNGSNLRRVTYTPASATAINACWRPDIGTTDVPGVPDDARAGVELLPAYPNPLGLGTTLGYTILRPARVSLRVLDLHGRVVETLADGAQSPGRHALHWRPKGLSSGVYFCRLESNGIVRTQKLILLRQGS